MKPKLPWQTLLRRCGATLCLMLGLHFAPAAGEVELAQLKTSAAEFRNVKIFRKTTTHLSFAHETGTAVLKLADIDANSLAAVERALAGLPAATTDASGGEVESAAATSGKASPAKWSEQLTGKLRAESLPPGVTPRMVWYALGICALMYLFYCYCCSLICAKTGRAGGLLVWLPVLQMIPMFRAAGMSGWWFLAMFVPLLNLVGQVLWCVKITQARGKGFFTAVMLILPLTNILAFLYLAFSNGHRQADDAFTPVRPPHALPVS
jgi:hypothetical protein